MSKESFVDNFNEPKPKEAKAKEPVVFLNASDCDSPAVYEGYVSYLSKVMPTVLKLDPKPNGYSAQEVWEKMNESDRGRANKAFRKKGRGTGIGKVKVEIAKNPDHAKAIELKKTVEAGMYNYAAKTFVNELEELQSLNPEAELTFEIYAKGWKEFTKLWVGEKK